MPALLLAAVLGGAPAAAGARGGGGSSSEGGGVSFGGVMFVMAFLGWFASLATGPHAVAASATRAAYGIGYRAQAFAYLLLVTDRYPNADPGPLLASVEPPAVHAVHIADDANDPRRSRVTVLLPAPARDPAPRLAPALVGARVLRRDRAVVRDALPRAARPIRSTGS